MEDLLSALSFPREIHDRSPDPGPFADYRDYKPHLQKEFRRKCVYCREADGFKAYSGFGVDHYQPKSKAKDPNTWTNLFYACNECNTWKGSKESTPERFIPNPCNHRMAEHIQYKDATFETYTPHGAWMAHLLRFSKRQERRRFVLSTVGKQVAAYMELIDTLALLERVGAPGSTDPDLAGEYRNTVAELEEMRRLIEWLTGEPVPFQS
jgi:hypothetical protein